MKLWIARGVSIGIVLLVVALIWAHRPPSDTQSGDDSTISLTGPLADWFGGKSKAEAPPAAKAKLPDSPVGTNQTVLRKTFGVTSAVTMAFEVPPHAALAKLRGTYHSFVQTAGAQAGDDEGNVEFLLLNEEQHSDLQNGRPSEAVFSVEGGHDQEVNVILPPTVDQPAKYWLLFRKGPGAQGKQVVQADFRIDF
jgi:hypothetical protein